MDDDNGLESDDEMCAYEKLRARNIAKRQKKFAEYKLANLVSELTTAYKPKKKKTSPKKSTSEKEMLPQRIMPSRNCKPKNFHEDVEKDESDLDEPLEDVCDLDEPSENESNSLIFCYKNW